MKQNQRSLLVVAALALTLSTPQLALAGGGSGAHYKVGEGGKIEFYPDGSPKTIMGNVQCTGVKIKVMAEAASYGAIQVPQAAKLTSYAVFEDPGFSRPMVVAGVPLEFTADVRIAELAARTVGPAKPGFVWLGFRSNGVLEGIAGDLSATGYWVYSFESYPSEDQVGPHEVLVFTSDNAERVKPSVDVFSVYTGSAALGVKLP
jgi:hypothetical protein